MVRFGEAFGRQGWGYCGLKNEWKALTSIARQMCAQNTQKQSIFVFPSALNQQTYVLSSQNMTSAHVFNAR